MHMLNGFVPNSISASGTTSWKNFNKISALELQNISNGEEAALSLSHTHLALHTNQHIPRQNTCTSQKAWGKKSIFSCKSTSNLKHFSPKKEQGSTCGFAKWTAWIVGIGVSWHTEILEKELKVAVLEIFPQRSLPVLWTPTMPQTSTLKYHRTRVSLHLFHKNHLQLTGFALLNMAPGPRPLFPFIFCFSRIQHCSKHWLKCILGEERMAGLDRWSAFGCWKGFWGSWVVWLNSCPEYWR